MNAIMEKSFDSLESALTQLIESISSYNPSPLAASAVFIADNGISESLELLAEHQSNHHKIQLLRATSEALDVQLTQLITALAQIRKELQAVPSTSIPPSRNIPYDELLTYARKISKYTRPPHHLRSDIPLSLPSPLPNASGSESHPPSIPNGTTTSEQPTTTRADMGLTEQEEALLDPTRITTFTPWPSEELMGRGALATVMFMGEQAALLSAEEAAVMQRTFQEQRMVNGGAGGEAGKQQDVQGDAEGGNAMMMVNGHMDGGVGGGAGGEQARAGGTVGGGATQREYADRERQSREAAAHAAVFSGLDLYDPDED